MKGLIFTYLLTCGGSIGAFFNPFIGVLAYVCLALVSPTSMWHWAVTPHPYSRIVGIAMLIGWALHGFGRWDLNKAWGGAIALLGFFMWSVFSALSSFQQEVAWDFVIAMSKIVIPVIVGLTLIDSVSKLKQLAWVIMLSQGLVAFEMNLSYYAGFNRMQMGGFGGLDNNSMAIAAVSGFGLALFLGMGATKWWQRLLSWTCAILMGHSVMFSFSRGGMLALIISFALSFLLIPKRNPKHWIAWLAILLIGFRLAGPEVVGRFSTTFSETSERDGSAQSRLDLWEDNWDVMKRYPILGIGPDHWPLIAHEYGWPPLKEGHSLWLQTGAELGFPGLGFLLLFYLLNMKRLVKIIRDKKDEFDPWLCDAGRMVIVSLAGFLVSSQFVSLEGLEIPYYINMLGAGVLAVGYRASAVSPVNMPMQVGQDMPIFKPQPA